MKKFYILFLAVPILFLTVLYLSVWLSVGIIAITLAFIAYRFYAERLESAFNKNTMLETNIDTLNMQLEQAVLKEQKTSREASKVRQSKQQLLSVLSHEIRTPMNGVMGTTLLLSDTSLTKEQRDYVNTIHRCSESLLTTVNSILVNDILDFSKLQKEENQLEYKVFELRDSVEEVLELFAEKTAKTGIDLLYYIGEDVPEQVIGDNKRIKQILINLVENAVKFTGSGEIFVNIQTSPPDYPGNPPYLFVEVRDSGAGMTENQLAQLFKGIPGKESIKNETGLGLVICKKLVELMGGTIEAKSQPGQGSIFSFRIPLTPGLKPSHSQFRQDDLQGHEGKHILIIDDNATRCSILLKQMKSWKMEPVAANNEAQAMEILASRKEFDLLIINLGLHVTNGLQLSATIRKKYPGLPIIGLNTPGDKRHEQEPPIFAGLIAKPIRQHILKDKVFAVFGPPAPLNENSMSEIFAMQYPLRILVAEDNNVNQKIALKILERLGYEAALANHGKEVMEMVDLQPYDIILMDVQMPEMNGLEATRLIRTCLDKQPVIIALTANAMEGDRDECMQAGMDDYMSKPIELEELVAKLQKWSQVIRTKRKSSL